jgi:predicted transcriptional regulator of viral defense system
MVGDRTKLSTLAAFVDSLQASGHYIFRKQEALATLNLSETAMKSAARRLVAKKRIVSPRRGFFVIVPLEYRSAGAPPPPWYVDDLMKFHRHPYYVGLLSAAAFHGAAHQQPQEFQVVTNTPLRPTRVGRARIRFFVKRNINRTPTVEIKTYTGCMRVSTPEATVLDLVRYSKCAGYLGNVATVLADLTEKLDKHRLVEAAQVDVELSCVQRLGFLLDLVGATHLATPLARWLATRSSHHTSLRSDRPADGAPKDPRWHILVNETVEVDQ